MAAGVQTVTDTNPTCLEPVYARAVGTGELMSRQPQKRAPAAQVKCLERRTEEDVPITDLARYLALGARPPGFKPLSAAKADDELAARGSEDALDEPARRRRSDRR